VRASAQQHVTARAWRCESSRGQRRDRHARAAAAVLHAGMRRTCTFTGTQCSVTRFVLRSILSSYHHRRHHRQRAPRQQRLPVRSRHQQNRRHLSAREDAGTCSRLHWFEIAIRSSIILFIGTALTDVHLSDVIGTLTAPLSILSGGTGATTTTTSTSATMTHSGGATVSAATANNLAPLDERMRTEWRVAALASRRNKLAHAQLRACCTWRRENASHDDCRLRAMRLRALNLLRVSLLRTVDSERVTVRTRCNRFVFTVAASSVSADIGALLQFACVHSSYRGTRRVSTWWRNGVVCAHSAIGRRRRVSTHRRRPAPALCHAVRRPIARRAAGYE
jgi:hypothetical protein